MTPNDSLIFFAENGWTFCLFLVAILLALYFIQKYNYLLDEKLVSETEQDTRKRTRRKPTITRKNTKTRVHWALSDFDDIPRFHPD